MWRLDDGNHRARSEAAPKFSGEDCLVSGRNLIVCLSFSPYAKTRLASVASHRIGNIAASVKNASWHSSSATHCTSSTPLAAEMGRGGGFGGRSMSWRQSAPAFVHTHLLSPPAPHESLLGVHEPPGRILLERRHDRIEDVLDAGVCDRVVGAVVVLVDRLLGCKDVKRETTGRLTPIVLLYYCTGFLPIDSRTCSIFFDVPYVVLRSEKLESRVFFVTI